MTKTTKDIFKIVFFAILIIAIIVYGPLATIWALNTLFPVLSIPYTFYSWLAVIVMNLTWMYKPAISKD
jgi:hypothetical protein